MYLTPAVNGQFVPAKDGLGHWLFQLTLKEINILGSLWNSINNLVTREKIMINIWRESDSYTGRSLDVFISKLRGYLKEDPQIRIIIIPIMGYILEIKG